METIDFLEKIHAGADHKCHISLLSYWHYLGQENINLSDRYFTNEELFTAAQNVVISKMEDVYFSLNSFRRHRREAQHVWHLNAIAIDYDYYKFKKYKHLTPEEMYEGHIKKDLLHQPTYVVDSGRGLYLIYAFNHCSRVRTAVYQKIYKYMTNSQEKYGADTKATLVTQVIRLPGTINSNSMTEVKVIESNDTNYELLDFVNYLPYSYEEIKQIKSKKRIKSVNSKLYRRARKIDYFENVYSDLKLLVKTRNTNKHYEGYREYLLYLVNYMAMYYGMSLIEAYKYSHKINKMLAKPMTTYQVEKQCKPSKICSGVMSIKTIISKLEITIEEQQQLKTLISDEAKYIYQKRKKAARSIRYLGRTEKEFKLYLRRSMISKLQRTGLGIVHIARELKISKQLVYADIKYIKKNAYEFFKKLTEFINELNDALRHKNFTRGISRRSYIVLSKWLEISQEQLE